MATAINTVAGSAAIPSVDMPNPANTPRKRTQAANAFSVNEPGEPLRAGGNALVELISVTGMSLMYSTFARIRRITSSRISRRGILRYESF
jgi:hypothetical protein